MFHVYAGQEQGKKRLFVAINVPCVVKSELCRLQKIFSKQDVLVGIYTLPDAMHLTLKFLGSVPYDKVMDIQNALSIVKFKSVDARLASIGYFGSKKNQKIIYVKVDCPALQDLTCMIDSLLFNLCAYEKREFISHLTIVRIKQIIDNDRLVALINETVVNPIDFKIDCFDLMQSKLASPGPVYSILKRYELIP